MNDFEPNIQPDMLEVLKKQSRSPKKYYKCINKKCNKDKSEKTRNLLYFISINFSITFFRFSNTRKRAKRRYYHKRAYEGN